MSEAMLSGAEEPEKSIDDNARAELLAAAETLASRRGPLVDGDRDAEVAAKIKRMAQLVDVA